MAKNRETKFRERIEKDFVRFNVMKYSLVAGRYHTNGWPDCLYCHAWLGLFLIEWKAHDTTIDPLQVDTINELRRRNARVWCVREPNIVYLNEFETIEFDGTGGGLLKLLRELTTC